MVVLPSAPPGTHATLRRGAKLLRSGEYIGVPAGQKPPHAKSTTAMWPLASLMTE